jgi:DNA anti-recombination protein RmuC
MTEVESLAIGVLGLALIVAIWFIANKKGVDENQIEKIAKLMAVEIAKEEREELGRESDIRANQLAKQTEFATKNLTDDVVEVKGENVTLKNLVKAVSDAQERNAKAIQTSTEVSQKVANALGGNDSQIKKEYGEGRAENILTMCGFREGEHFVKQTLLDTGGFPDIALILPGGGAVAIDCKAILKPGFNAFYELDSEEDAAKKKELLKKHASNIWDTVKELATRNYPLGLEQLYGKGPDYTLMFIPSEEFYYRAELGVSNDLRKSMGYKTLREAAIRKSVFFCSPDNLAMRAIELTEQWKSISALEEMKEIVGLVGDVADAIVRTEEKKAAHHKALENVLNSWNDHIKEMESTHANREKPSLRVAITNLIKRVGAKGTFSSVRGKKGSKAEPIPLSEISKSPIEPTKAAVDELQSSSSMAIDIIVEEE